MSVLPGQSWLKLSSAEPDGARTSTLGLERVAAEAASGEADPVELAGASEGEVFTAHRHGGALAVPPGASEGVARSAGLIVVRHRDPEVTFRPGADLCCPLRSVVAVHGHDFGVITSRVEMMFLVRMLRA
ncbi:hypothetical protein QFW96_19535 [Saccharopolyspora sp. TS4A08]|uniref:Uncharacterized protein n=1 Tax=Saccharopolyspora ipomoeae TaxID=3042027 RepID=A0ABT6PS84_9PSEU|nr:hypothetical protein [Saccharopolyspora sp. TS4A08]MDI2030834.1 hypothetical protein [Saccharopolyspora sp. TS4A08]